MSQKLEDAKNLYLEGIRDGNIEMVKKYTGDRYTQHSTGVADGAEGFIDFFSGFLERTNNRDIRLIRTLEDGRFVFVHAYQDIDNGTAKWITTDMFDTDANHKIIEHWDVIAAYREPHETVSGNDMILGDFELQDLDKTEENKALIRNFLVDVMQNKNHAALDKYVSSQKYIQHNPEVEDGLAHFQRLATAPNRPLNYDEIVLMVGQGNFVATLCRANWNDGKINQDYAQVDLFRIENGKVVEHWDNVEPVPENDVNSGKF